MISRKDFGIVINSMTKQCPKEWRKGQAVFNVLDSMGLARPVQLEDMVDCFYNDDAIEQFLDCAWKRYSDMQKT